VTSSRRSLLKGAAVAVVAAASPSMVAAVGRRSAATNLKYGATGSQATQVFRPSAMTGRAIQLAIDAAHADGGGVVRLAAGTYMSNVHLVVKSNVAVVGAGQTTVIKAGPGFISSGRLAGGYPVISTDGHHDVTVKDLTADQSGDILNGNVRGRMSAYLVEARDSTNVVIDGVHTINPFTYSIAVLGTSRFAIRNCSTRVVSSGRYNQLDGIHILDSSSGDVVDNHVDQRIGRDGDDGLAAHSIRAATHDLRFARNRVRGGNNGNAMQLAVGDHALYNLTITDNVFYDSPYGIRTGYYDNGTGAVSRVTITSNHIWNVRGGHAFPIGGEAVNIGGFAIDRHRGPVTYVRCMDNVAVRAGGIFVAKGVGNVVSGNLVISAGSRRR
jgi:polygalacturonase